MRIAFSVIFLSLTSACAVSRGQGNANLASPATILAPGGGAAAELRINDAGGIKYWGIISPTSLPATIEWTGMPTDGTAGQAIVTDGAKHLSFATISGAGLPVPDTTIITQNAADPTKQQKFDDSLISTGTTRTYKWQDANYTVAGIDIANVFSGGNNFTVTQTFNNDIVMTGPGGGAAGSIDFDNPSPGIGAIKLTIPGSGGSIYAFTLPPNGGTSGYALKTNGSGTTSWDSGPNLISGQVIFPSQIGSSGTFIGPIFAGAIQNNSTINSSSLASGSIQCVDAGSSGTLATTGFPCAQAPGVWSSWTPGINSYGGTAGTVAQARYTAFGKIVTFTYQGSGVMGGGSNIVISAPVANFSGATNGYNFSASCYNGTVLIPCAAFVLSNNIQIEAFPFTAGTTYTVLLGGSYESN
jgi:hypothetical protein